MLAGTGTTVVVVTYNRMLRRLVDLLTDGQIKARTMHSFVSRRYRVQNESRGSPAGAVQVRLGGDVRHPGRPRRQAVANTCDC